MLQALSQLSARRPHRETQGGLLSQLPGHADFLARDQDEDLAAKTPRRNP